MRASRWVAAVGTCVGLVGGGIAWSDGTETLGPPVGLTVASGTGIAVGGVGLVDSPSASGSFQVTVPAGATVKQVILYWEGMHRHIEPGDAGIVVNGNPVTGTLIGGPTTFFAAFAVDGVYFIQSSAYRADITGLGAVGPGTSTINVSGFDFTYRNDGVGAMVIFDAGGTQSAIRVVDGNDLAFVNFAPPLDTTVPQIFTFPAASSSRVATLQVFAGSVERDRPNAIALTVAGVTSKLVNPLGSNAGNEWDVVTVPVTIPAGATSLTVQLLSESDGSSRLPASMAWIASGLSVPGVTTTPPPPPPSGVGTGTVGFWKNHPGAWPVNSLVLGTTTYSKSQLLDILRQPPRGDMTIILAHQLIAAKLNVASGTEASCITSTISAADAFLASNPLGSGVKSSSAESLKNTLDAYNNGLLCAPHRG